MDLAGVVSDLQAMTSTSPYRRLPGRAGLIIRSSLWMQPDHVLRLRRHAFSEEYRRYYFADIQAIVLTELPATGSYYGYAIAAALILGAGALASALDFVSAGFLTVIGLLVFLIAVRRRNCACYLKTRVSTEELPSLRRLSTARKAVAILKAEIQRAQGELTQETLVAQHAVLGATPAATKPETPHYNGVVHWILFGLVLLRGILAAIVLADKLYAWQFSMFGSLVSAGVLLLALIGAVKQHRTDMARGVRWLVYSVLSWYALSAVGIFSISLYLGVLMGKAGPRSPIDTTAVMNHPVMRYTQLTDVAVLILLGCAGLILMWTHHNSQRTPPPLAPENQGLGAA
jgi:hypothetical protein